MEVKKGYKQTEVGVIPKDWDEKPFNKVSFIKGRIGWQGLTKAEFTANADEPFLITGMNFKEGAIRWEEVYHVSHSRYEIAKEIQLRVNDILMTKDGTIGKLLFVDKIPFPGKATLNSHLLVYRPLHNSYVPKFLYYQLSSKYFRDYIELSKSGSTFFGLSQAMIEKYGVVLPSTTEQTAIANALSDTDELIQSLEKLIIKKRNIKQGAMQELLKPKEGWVVKPISEDIDLLTGYPFPSNKYKESGIKLLRCSNIKRGNTDWSEDITQYWEKITFELKQYVLKEGDIVIAMDGSLVGKSFARLKNSDLPALLLQRVARVRSDQIDLGYLKEFICSDYFARYCDSVKTVTAIPHISPADIKNFSIPIPPTKSEQTRIANILSDMDEEITALEKKLAKYKLIKQGMMQELLTGRIRLV